MNHKNHIPRNLDARSNVNSPVPNATLGYTVVQWYCISCSQQGFEIRTGLEGPTGKTENRTKIRFFKHKNRVYMSSERTGQTRVQLEKSDEP